MPIRRRFQLGAVDGVKVGRLDRGLMSNFIVYRLGETVVDCGPSNQWPEVKRFLEEKPFSQVFLTHHHEDHSGNAARIADQFKLTPFAPALSQAKLASGFKIPPFQVYYWGRPIPVKTQLLPAEMLLPSGHQLVAIHAPGHAKDMHCLYVPEEGWLFTADLFIARRLKFFRADENLDQLLKSIRHVLTYDIGTIFCAHRGIIEEGALPLREKLRNMLAFCEEVQALHARGLQPPRIVSRLLGRESLLAHFTKYNFSKRNLVTEALKVDLTEF